MNPQDSKSLCLRPRISRPNTSRIFAADLQNAHPGDNPVLEQINHTFSEHPRSILRSTRDRIQMGTRSGTPALPVRWLPRKFLLLINTRPCRDCGKGRSGAVPTAMEEGLFGLQRADEIGVSSTRPFCGPTFFRQSLEGAADSPSRERGVG